MFGCGDCNFDIKKKYSYQMCKFSYVNFNNYNNNQLYTTKLIDNTF